MRISDWSSDVCSSDLHEGGDFLLAQLRFQRGVVEGAPARAVVDVLVAADLPEIAAEQHLGIEADVLVGLDLVDQLGAEGARHENAQALLHRLAAAGIDRKSTRLNSSH